MKMLAKRVILSALARGQVAECRTAEELDDWFERRVLS